MRPPFGQRQWQLQSWAAVAVTVCCRSGQGFVIGWQTTKALPVISSRMTMAQSVFDVVSENSETHGRELVLKKDWTVSDCLVRMRRLRRMDKKSTSLLSDLGLAWVVEEDGLLVGKVGATELILSEPSTRLHDIVQPTFAVNATDDVDDALIALRANNVTVAAVVNDAGALIATLTPSDVIATLEAEATEDVVRLATSGGLGEGYFAANAIAIIRNRAAWLLSLLMLQSLSSMVLNRFSALLGRNLLLALYLTTLTGTAGNAGGQTSAVVIRGLATGEIDSRRDAARVLRRELQLATPLAFVLGGAAFIRVLLTARGRLDAVRTAVTIASAMSFTVLSAIFVGTGAPLFLDRIQIDPCNCASPVLATFVDLAGVLVLCSIGSVLL